MKRGLSEVVTTVLIIFIIIIALVIIWSDVIPLIKQSLPSNDACSSLDFNIDSYQGYTCYDPNSLTAIQVKNGNSNVPITALKVYLTYKGNSFSYKTNVSLEKNTEQTFYLNSSFADKIEQISIAPIITNGAVEKECSPISVKNIKNCNLSNVQEQIIQPTENSTNNSDNQNNGTVPNIFVYSPTNSNQYTNSNVTLNVGSNQNGNWFYNLNNSANISFTPNTTLSLADGSYSLKVYINNSNGTNYSSLVFSVNTSSGGSLVSGLVGYWKFDETSGTVAADSSGNGLNGKINNLIFNSSGKISNAFNFPGTTNNVNVTDNALLDLGGPISIGAWVWIDPSISSVAGIVERNDDNTRRSYDLRYEGGKIAATLEEGCPNARGRLDIITTADVNTAQWTYIVFSWDGSNYHIYFDSVDQPLTVRTNGITNSSVCDNTLPLTIGTRSDIITWVFKGTIDEVSLWDKYLNQTDVDYYYNNGNGRSVI